MQVPKAILSLNTFICLYSQILILFIISFYFVACNKSNDNVVGTKVKFYFTNDSIRINNSIYYSNIKINELNKEIGVNSKTFKGANDIYTWDTLGLTAYCINDTKDIIEIKFNFLKSDYEFSPELLYSGIILIDSLVINYKSQIEFLRNNGFEYPTKYKIFLSKEIGKFNINAFLNRDNTKIEYIAINIKS